MKKLTMNELLQRAAENDPKAFFGIARIFEEYFPELAPYWRARAKAAEQDAGTMSLIDVFELDDEELEDEGAFDPHRDGDGEEEEDWDKCYSQDPDEDEDSEGLESDPYSFEEMFRHTLDARKGDTKAAMGLYDDLQMDEDPEAPEDEEQAMEYLKMAASGGNPDCQLWLAQELLYDEEDVSNWAIHWFAKSSEQGDPRATLELASLYFSGFFTGREDKKRALARFELAERQGAGQAAFRAGDMYFTGLGIERDEGKALKYWKRARELKHGQGTYELGMCHLLGLGSLEQDETKAKACFLEAAQLGSKEAAEELALLGGAEGQKWQRIAQKLQPQTCAIVEWEKSQPIQMRVRKPNLQLIKK